MSRNRLIALALVAVVAVGGYLAYDNVLRGDDVAPLALPSASAPAGTATPSASTDPGTTASTGTGTGPSAGTGDKGDVAGTWTAVEGSEAGYRVREQLANLPAESDAIGRTRDVSGSITLVATAG